MNLKSVQIDILDMFETGAREGKDVFDIVGNDVTAKGVSNATVAWQTKRLIGSTRK